MRETDSWKTFERTGLVEDYLQYKSSVREETAKQKNCREEKQKDRHERFCGSDRNGSDGSSGGRI